MRKLLTFIVVLTFSLSAFSDPVQIGELRYILHENEKTAEVTYHSLDFKNQIKRYNDGWDITHATVPGWVYYNGEPYRVTRIGDYAFKGCKKLRSVSLPNTLTAIGLRAFSHCDVLDSVDIPDGVSFIRMEAFDLCNKLRHLTLPANLKKILYRTFSYCDLSKIVIPNGVEYIGRDAFVRNDSISSLVIPASVTAIDNEAFYLHRPLDSLKCLAAEPPGASEFPFFYDTIKPLYVPAESVEKYKANDVWGRYNIQPIAPLYVIAVYRQQHPTPDSEADQTCYMEFMGKEIGGDEYEELILNFSYNKSTYVINKPDTTKRLIHYTNYIAITAHYLQTTYYYYSLPDGSNRLYNVQYTVFGDGVIYDSMGTYADTGGPVMRQAPRAKYNHLGKVITKEFYDILKDIIPEGYFKTENAYKPLTWEEYQKKFR